MPATPVELWWQDEMRLGQKNGIVRQWARIGGRPRQTYLSNRVFGSYEDIVDAACHAWNKLIDKPPKIMSIGMRKWAHEGQIQ